MMYLGRSSKERRFAYLLSLSSQDKCRTQRQKAAAVNASFFGRTYICEPAFALINRPTDGNLRSILQLTTTSVTPELKRLAPAVQSQRSHE